MAKRYEEMQKDERIAYEEKSLRALYTKLPVKKKRLVDGLIQNAAFMKSELYELQEYIMEHGCTCTYQNGENQWGEKKSPQAEQYNTMIKNYTAVITKLNDMIPKDEKKIDDDGFDDFVNGKE